MVDFENYYYQNEYKKLSERLDAEKEELDRMKAAERARAEIEKQKAAAAEAETEKTAEPESKLHAAVQARIDKYKGAKQ